MRARRPRRRRCTAALDDFENSWDDGRGQIEKNMTAMREILQDCVNAYITNWEAHQ